MKKKQPNYEFKNDEDVSKFLLGLIRDTRSHKIDYAEGLAAARAVNRYTKNREMELKTERLALKNKKQLQKLQIEIHNKKDNQ